MSFSSQTSVKKNEHPIKSSSMRLALAALETWKIDRSSAPSSRLILSTRQYPGGHEEQSVFSTQMKRVVRLFLLPSWIMIVGSVAISYSMARQAMKVVFRIWLEKSRANNRRESMQLIDSNTAENRTVSMSWSLISFFLRRAGNYHRRQQKRSRYE